MNIFCLICWIIMLIEGLIRIAKKKEINKVAYICAMIVCILHYLGRIGTYGL